MKTENTRSGSCLCGAVKIHVDVEKTDLGACHCATCLKWSGGPLMELEVGSDVEFQGHQNIQTYESSKWAIRGFCKVCGTHLFIKEKNANDYGVPAGIFVNQKGISFNRQVFYDNKPSYYSFSNPTLDITSEYIYEHFPHTKK